MSLNKLFGSLAIQTRGIKSHKNFNPKKFPSILQDIPPRPRSAWLLFIRENAGVMKGKEGGLGEAAGILAERWRNLDEKEKEKFKVQFQKEKELHETAYAEALNKATPQQIQEENFLRKKYKLPLLKDPKKPKRPLNAFVYYYTSVADKFDDKSVRVADRAKQISLQYKALSDSEKEPFKKQAEEARAKYNKEIESYNKKAIGSK
ncbi:high mobility group box domain-containing protein [Sporodiniella umbellata]|nr:high mobility group box domain-containing protein [Sporodiniella umbellata]